MDPHLPNHTAPFHMTLQTQPSGWAAAATSSFWEKDYRKHLLTPITVAGPNPGWKKIILKIETFKVEDAILFPLVCISDFLPFKDLNPMKSQIVSQTHPSWQSTQLLIKMDKSMT